MRLIYLDESKRANRYLIASTTVDAAGAIEVRRELGRLVLPGQRRLHFKSESERRRRELLDVIVELECSIRVYSVRRLAEPDARSLALSAVVRDAQAAGGDSTVYIERVEGLESLDQATITRTRLRQPSLTWHHLSPSEDPVLWVSDAIAWAVGAGGAWRERVEARLDAVIELSP
jgi:hypothetical protein